MSVTKSPAGKTSAMRVGFLTCLVVGTIVTVCGVVGMFLSLADAGIAMTTGSALLSASGFAKAVQSRYENQTESK